MRSEVDAITIGGSVSGLLAAREVAKAGFEVNILEEDLEIGIPERCDGLVSSRCLETLGVAPSSKIIQNRISRAIITSPNGKKAEIDASSQQVLVLDRSQFDRELARMAILSGANIIVGNRVTGFKEVNGLLEIKTNLSTYMSDWLINASGYSNFSPQRKATLQASKYEVIGHWFERDTIEIYLNQNVSPGYFLWVIPINDDIAKIGIAGYGVNQFKVLDDFINKKKGKCIKKTSAQIITGGPIDHFYHGKVVHVGDSAGQTKPTTGGGIYSGGLGGILAGISIAKCIKSGNPNEIINYERKWRSIFGREFSILLNLRKILSVIDNNTIDNIFNILYSSGIFEKISADGDFDMHSAALIRALGLKKVFQIGRAVTSSLVSNFGEKKKKRYNTK